MIYNKPAANAWQLDRCDVCGDKWHRRDLVRTQVEFLEGKAENYFTYSSYDGTFWVVDSASSVTGSTGGSYGNRCDNVRLTLDDDNNLTYLNPVSTWTGNGTMRSTSLPGYFTSTSDLTFSAQVGPHEQNTSPDMTVVLGVCNSDGSSKSALKTYSINTMTKCWVNAEVQTLADTGLGDQNGSTYAFYWYIQITNAGNWWIDEMQLEANVNSLPTSADGQPENFVRTSGAIVSHQSDQTLMTSRKVCPNCKERILSKSNRYGRQDEQPVAQPVATWTQEI